MLERDKRARENIEKNLTRTDRQNLGERENIPTRIETTRSEPIFNIPTRIETTRSEPIFDIPTRIESIHEPNVTSDPDPPPYDLSDSSSSDSEKKRKKRQDKKKRRKHRKMIRQTRPRVMILMTLIHWMTVIIDASDAGERNIRKKDPIRLCATLTAKFLTTAFKSKMIRFKLDEDHF